MAEGYSVLLGGGGASVGLRFGVSSMIGDVVILVGVLDRNLMVGLVMITGDIDFLVHPTKTSPIKIPIGRLYSLFTWFISNLHKPTFCMFTRVCLAINEST